MFSIVLFRSIVKLQSADDAFFFFQAEDGIRDYKVTGVQTCALPIYGGCRRWAGPARGWAREAAWPATPRPAGRSVRTGWDAPWSARLPRQLGAAIEERPHLVGLGRGQVEDHARGAGVAIALDEIEVLGYAEHGDGNARGIAAGRRGHRAELRALAQDVAVGRTARVRQPAVAVRDRPPRPVRKRAADDHRR